MAELVDAKSCNGVPLTSTLNNKKVPGRSATAVQVRVLLALRINNKKKERKQL